MDAATQARRRAERAEKKKFAEELVANCIKGGGTWNKILGKR